MNTLDYLFLILAWPQSEEFGATFQPPSFKEHAICFGLDIGLSHHELQQVLQTEIIDIVGYKRAITGLACLKYEQRDHAHELWGVVDAISNVHRSLA